ncbi:hypothetical protein [Spiroplasma alleghenense]|uniref:Uncharacterized protein n=1 Tax=Spiroplasma alleghenense TaxID=216931 RepID=A0A345Z4G9_9MOLU|nr:hypothetical protein [Spiroplasma alleghenense]AXK51498.1 hypothetical protein SALLE_v1c08280 [Spiroplasma alleghenense]
MAKINGNEVEFDQKELQAAWDKAIVLENADPNVMKMCYVCKYHMLKENYFNFEKPDTLQWYVDLIDTTLKDLFVINNLIAIHNVCLEFRKKKNATKRIEKIRKVKWNFDEEFHQ